MSRRIILIIGLTLLVMTSALGSQPVPDQGRSFQKALSAIDHPLTGNGCVTVIMNVSRKGSLPFHFEHRIWFSERKWRVESLSGRGRSSRRYLEYQIHDGASIFYATKLAGSANDPKWYGYPSSLVDVSLYTYLQPGHPAQWLKHARLLGIEQVQGLPAEHWQGDSVTEKGRKSVSDIWVSTDSTFPLILRMERRSSGSSFRFSWQITHLDLRTPISGCVFTPQVYPKSDLMSILRMPYKPAPLFLALWGLRLLVYMGIMYFLVAGRKGISVGVRAAGLLILSVLFVLLVRVPGKGDLYQYSWQGTPVIMTYVLLAGLLAVYLIARIGLPDGFQLFKGTKWTVALFVILSLSIGVFGMYSYQHLFGMKMGITKWHLPLIPPVFVNVLLFMGVMTAVEELLFRGYIFGVLQRHMGSVRSVIIAQAVIFALYHIPTRLELDGTGFRLIRSMISLAGMGVIFGILRSRYKNLGVPWLVHLAYNTGSFYVAYASAVGMASGLQSMLK